MAGRLNAQEMASKHGFWQAPGLSVLVVVGVGQRGIIINGLECWSTNMNRALFAVLGLVCLPGVSLSANVQKQHLGEGLGKTTTVGASQMILAASTQRVEQCQELLRRCLESCNYTGDDSKGFCRSSCYTTYDGYVDY